MAIGDAWADGAWVDAGWVSGAWFDSGVPFASINMLNLTESQIVSGGQQIVITLSNDTWVNATFDAQRQNIIDGLTSAQSELTGWNNEVRDNEVVTAVVRTSDTVVTITLSAAASYDVTADETITVTIPATALVTSGSALVASPTISVTADVEVSAETGGITKSARRRRYLVEIDGEFFDADSVFAVEALLKQAEETAEESAQKDVLNAPKKTRIKPPKVKVKTASGAKPTSVTIAKQIATTQRRINKIYRDAHREVEQIREIATLMQKKIQEEDDTIIALLL